jgi:PadR family transcriptional regulator, regulatory protein PadR
LNSEPTSLLQGTLDLLILKSLATGEMHGLGISRRIQRITGGTFVVKPGSLFPALHRMEDEGWTTSFWGDSENNRRAKYYRSLPKILCSAERKSPGGSVPNLGGHADRGEGSIADRSGGVVAGTALGGRRPADAKSIRGLAGDVTVVQGG